MADDNELKVDVIKIKVGRCGGVKVVMRVIGKTPLPDGRKALIDKVVRCVGTVDLERGEFTRLRVVSQVPAAKKRGPSSLWRCECAKDLGGCGRTRTARASHLPIGLVKSCGCLRTENLRRMAADGTWERNEAIRHRYNVNGETLASIAADYGLTRQRVEQIVHGQKVGAGIGSLGRKIMDALATGCTGPLEVADQIGAGPGSVRSYMLRMAHQGMIEKTGHGSYRLAPVGVAGG